MDKISSRLYSSLNIYNMLYTSYIYEVDYKNHKNI